MKDNSRYQWYLNRLKTMSLQEMVFRGEEYLRIPCLRGINRKSGEIQGLEEWPRPVLPAARIQDYPIETGFTIFGKKLDLTGDINWHKDLFTGAEFPMIHARSINIRNTKNISAKVVWELNRMQFLTLIALQYRKTGKSEFPELFMRITKNWIEKNPYPLGVNWYSNIEVNLRLITWFLSWELLDINSLAEKNPDFGKFTHEDLIPSIFRHCLHSFMNPSRFSSANNHLISEYAGLYIASSYWKFNQSETWKLYARQGLEKEILRQFSASGINREEAAGYIQFVTDFFLLALIVGKTTGDEFSAGFQERLKKILIYIKDFLDCSGNFPTYGDEDDGRAFFLSYDNVCNNFQSLLISGATLFNDPVLKPSGIPFDLKNRILFGDKGKNIYDLLEPGQRCRSSSFYKEEGHYILRNGVESTIETYIHFDAAPLGYLSIAAHGHADCLSFILNVDGQPVLVDPGTYTYHTDPDFRQYFKGTLAHNTVRIDFMDQALHGGPTMWLRHFHPIQIHTESNRKYDVVEASHDGYIRNGVIHTRRIFFDKEKNTVQITDTLSVLKKASHTFELPFHVHPDLIVKAEDGGFFISGNGRQILFLTAAIPIQAKVKYGETDPVAGWYSDAFLHKRPASMILYKGQLDKTIQIETKINVLR